MSITSLSFNLVSHLNVQNFLSDDQILSLWVPSVSLLFHVRYYAVDVGIKINKIICCQRLSYIYVFRFSNSNHRDPDQDPKLKSWLQDRVKILKEDHGGVWREFPIVCICE